MTTSLTEQFGQIDIYLFDQLLRARIAPGMRVFDAGFGGGRNLVYLLRQGYEVFGVDADPGAVKSMRQLAANLAPALPADNFLLARVEAIPFPNHFADVVLSNAVLHFARDDQHFQAMLHGTWNVLKPGGLFFCRLASSIGSETAIQHIEGESGGGLRLDGAGRRYHAPDGSDRYLVDAQLLERLTQELGAEMIDPLKTTVVHSLRSMTTWVLRKK
jgi:tellurite methyltransferase